jgi:transposase
MIDRYVNISNIRQKLMQFTRSIGCSLIVPKPMIPMLLACSHMKIRAGEHLSEELRLNLACRWFCHLD